MSLTRINTAEAITDPFWEPGLEALEKWKIRSGARHGLRVEQYWCWVAFSWTRKPSRGPALSMSRTCDLDCAEYDTLMVSAVLPRKSVLRIRARTDQGDLLLETPPHEGDDKEYGLDLGGATRLRRLTLEIDVGAEEAQGGWFNWVGLRNSQRYLVHQRQWTGRDPRWEKHLKPASLTPEFVPRYGLLFNSRELGVLRRRHAAFLRKHGESPFTVAAGAARKQCPEELIHGYVGSGARYGRDDDPPSLQRHGLSAAVAGILMKDSELLRLAARATAERIAALCVAS